MNSPLDPIHPKFTEDLDEAWTAEIAARADEVRSGRSPGLPAEDVFAEAQALLDKQRGASPD